MRLRKCRAKIWNYKEKATVEVDALFHAWGVETRQESISGYDGGWVWVTDSVGIVELLDGSIEMVIPYQITFTDSQAVAERLRG